MDTHAHARRDDVMTEIHALDLRVSELELNHDENIRVRYSHEKSIAELVTGASNLKETMITNTGELKSLNGKIGVGIAVMVFCTGLLGSILGGFWNYSNKLDDRYAPKIDSIINSSRTQATQQKTNATQLEVQEQVINDLKESNGVISNNVQDIQNKKVIRSSR